ncbi:MAG: hypothetical protein AB1429_14235 [Pseudomonadota bacterium]
MPKPMDVVWCRFPYHNAPNVPGVTPHPGLVFATARLADGGLVVQVAFGTSNLKSESRPLDLRITNFRAMQYAGLYKATRFDLDKIKWLPWGSEWFASPDLRQYPTPKIGFLLSDSIEVLRRKLRKREELGLGLPARGPG